MCLCQTHTSHPPRPPHPRPHVLPLPPALRSSLSLLLFLDMFAALAKIPKLMKTARNSYMEILWNWLLILCALRCSNGKDRKYIKPICIYTFISLFRLRSITPREK